MKKKRAASRKPTPPPAPVASANLNAEIPSETMRRLAHFVVDKGTTRKEVVAAALAAYLEQHGG